MAAFSGLGVFARKSCKCFVNGFHTASYSALYFSNNLKFPRKLIYLSENRRQNSSLVNEFKKAVAQSDTKEESKRPLFWTPVDDPARHTNRHVGFFYSIPSEHFTRWLNKGLEVHFYRSVKTFNEACIMIRAPAVEVIDGLKSVDPVLPVLRYVFYGRNGCGKSTSLAHVIHYCGTQGWIIAHSPWAAGYNRWTKTKDIQYSTYRQGRVDQPLEAVQWLANFRNANELRLKELNIVTENQYTWSKREISEVGTPIPELVELGLNRVKYSSDIMAVVLKELRLQSTSGKLKLLVSIDGVNSFWDRTSIKQEDNRHRKHPPEELTIVHNWKKVLLNNWSNGAVVCTVDGNAKQPADKSRCYPLDLLGKDGFEHLDPFIPIHVNDYDDKEAFSCMQYYIDRKWIQDTYIKTEEGRRELISLTCNNPLEMYKFGVFV